MKLKHIITFLLPLIFLGCIKSKMDTAVVINDLTFSSPTITADGSSQVTISVHIDNDADSNKRNVSFRASTGSFINGKDSSISQKAVFVNSNLTAQVTYQAPMKPGMIYFVIQPDLSSSFNVTLTDSMMALRSEAAKVKLTISSFYILYGFLSEDTLTAKLTNSSGNSVSTGTKVIFDDYFPGGAQVNGRYREPMVSSNSSSQVSTIYSSGFAVAVNANIYVSVTVLDSVGNPTPIKDSSLITIIQ